MDYLPFGQEILAGSGLRTVGMGYNDATSVGTADVTSAKFTSKERDSESGLDYFGARYFSSAQGRFSSVDPKQVPHDITDPQSWNKYAYTRNNPLRYIDPDGEDWKDVAKGAFNGYTSDNQLGVGRAQGGNSDFRTGQAIGDAVATLQGVLQTLVGTGGEVLGLSLDATGAGAVAGVPINVASAGIIAQGATTAIVAGANLANSFASSVNDTPVNTMGGCQIGEPNGPKAGSAGGPGAGRRATANERGQALQENNGSCVFCTQPRSSYGVSRSRIND